MDKELKVMWPVIVDRWGETFLNYIDLGNYTMFRMLLYRTQNPRDGLFVAIEDKSSYFFSLDRHLPKDYVAVKLGLLGDAGQVADFLNAQLGHKGPQQGIYFERVIREIEPYGKMGEDKYMPWHPVIITNE